MLQILDEVQIINIYDNGSEVRLLPAQMGYKLVLNGFKNLIRDARRMPAFAVSLDGETRTAMGEGLWVEFDFGKPLIYAEMPFEKLLMQVNYNSKDGYAGRCFYYDINGTLSGFYDILKSV